MDYCVDDFLCVLYQYSYQIRVRSLLLAPFPFFPGWLAVFREVSPVRARVYAV